MRAPAIILLLTFTCFSVAAAAGADPLIPRLDVRDITAAVRQVTRQPILWMYPTSTDKPVPGAISYKTVRLGPYDQRTKRIRKTPIIRYRRTDEVSVLTGSNRNVTGPAYTLQKIGGAWQVVDKGEWIR